MRVRGTSATRLALKAATVVTLPVAFASLLLAAGCGGNDGPRGGPLTDTLWVLSSYPADAGLTEVPATVRSDIQFADGKVSGNSGVNQFAGGYESTDEGALTIGQLASTMMAGPEDATKVETAVLAALAEVAEYYADDSTLKLYDGEGAEVLVYAKDTATLTGSWIVIGYNNGKEAVVSALAGAELTAVFAEDGTLSGSAGVNTYNGSYTTSGSSIDIGPLATTKMAGPQDLMDQEQLYLAALDNATTYSVRGTELELRDDTGAMQVSYVRAGD